MRRRGRDPRHYVSPQPVAHYNGVAFSAPQEAFDWFGYADGQQVSAMGLVGLRRQTIIVLGIQGVMERLHQAAKINLSST
jgi:hypothetical protein